VLALPMSTRRWLAKSGDHPPTRRREGCGNISGFRVRIRSSSLDSVVWSSAKGKAHTFLSPSSSLLPAQSTAQRTCPDALEAPFQIFRFRKGKREEAEIRFARPKDSLRTEDGECKSCSLSPCPALSGLALGHEVTSNQRCCECVPGKTIDSGAILTQNSPLHEHQARSTASTSSSWLAWCLLAAAMVTQVSGWSGLGGILPIKATKMPRMSSRRSLMPAVGPSMQLRPPYIKVADTEITLPPLLLPSRSRDEMNHGACTILSMICLPKSDRCRWGAGGRSRCCPCR